MEDGVEECHELHKAMKSCKSSRTIQCQARESSASLTQSGLASHEAPVMGTEWTLGPPRNRAMYGFQVWVIVETKLECAGPRSQPLGRKPS